MGLGPLTFGAPILVTLASFSWYTTGPCVPPSDEAEKPNVTCAPIVACETCVCTVAPAVDAAVLGSEQWVGLVTAVGVFGVWSGSFYRRSCNVATPSWRSKHGRIEKATPARLTPGST